MTLTLQRRLSCLDDGLKQIRTNAGWVLTRSVPIFTAVVDANPQNGLMILFNYDDHYCRYFDDHTSTWTLELSERFQKKLGRKVSVIIDGKEKRIGLNAKQTIEIPAGMGIHKVEIKR